MDINLFRSALDALALYKTTGETNPIEHTHYGHFIKEIDGPGFVGGAVRQVIIDPQGRLIVKELTVSSILQCGHLVTGVEQIAGYCMVCGRVCCNLHNCLMVCDITGITVCRKHYKIKHGVVVSSVAQKGLWRLKAKKLGQKKRILIDERKQLTEGR
jgi:hypothetical protein